jgi:hypothetical protein
MNQPPPLPPDPPQQPLPLSYGRPPAISIAGQAVLGTLATTAAIVGMGFGAAFTVGMAASLGNAGFFAMIAIVCVISVGAGVLLARRFRRNPSTRGWAIGIYIGMGLAALFWGSCGMILYSLSNVH